MEIIIRNQINPEEDGIKRNLEQLEKQKAQIKDNIINKLKTVLDHVKEIKNHQSETKRLVAINTSTILHLLLNNSQLKHTAEIIPEPDGYNTGRNTAELITLSRGRNALDDSVNYSSNDISPMQTKETPMTERVGLPYNNNQNFKSFQEQLPVQTSLKKSQVKGVQRNRLSGTSTKCTLEVALCTSSPDRIR